MNSHKLIYVSVFVLILSLFITDKGWSQYCEKNNNDKWKVKCETASEKPCCVDSEGIRKGFKKAHCKGDSKEPFCCKKKEDGTWKCKDDEGNAYIPICSVNCSDVKDEGNADNDEEISEGADIEESEKEVNLQAQTYLNNYKCYSPPPGSSIVACEESCEDCYLTGTTYKCDYMNQTCHCYPKYLERFECTSNTRFSCGQGNICKDCKCVAAPTVAPISTPTPIPTQTPALATIGDRVWNDINSNGIQDSDEQGISNVIVKLLDNTNNIISVTVTDVTGAYLFTVPAGTYLIQVTAPNGYNFTLKDQGMNDTLDSDTDQITGKTDLFTVTAGQVNNTIDSGLIPPATIGDRVWNDIKRNGIQDSGEPGISNVTVKLLDNANNIISVTVTDVTGAYFFTVPAGTYLIQVIAINGYTFTLKDQGINDALDSDTDQITGKTDLFTVTAGQSNNTIDSGLILLPLRLP